MFRAVIMGHCSTIRSSLFFSIYITEAMLMRYDDLPFASVYCAYNQPSDRDNADFISAIFQAEALIQFFPVLSAFHDR
jgi:hypothetical protein